MTSRTSASGKLCILACWTIRTSIAARSSVIFVWTACRSTAAARCTGALSASRQSAIVRSIDLGGMRRQTDFVKQRPTQISTTVASDRQKPHAAQH
jgi:hypothetical protein